MRNRPKITKRATVFSSRASTRICQEIPSKNNPYLAESCYCHGYNLSELIQKCSFGEVLFLLFRGELPSETEAKILETLMIGFINPGPRHPATRAAMNAGVSKTNTAHLLPISLAVLGGHHLGANEVISSMRFIRRHLSLDPRTVAKDLLEQSRRPSEGDWHIAPGFGARFGGIDPIPQQIASTCSRVAGKPLPTLAWGCAFVDAINPLGLGWLSPGVCAAALSDLGFSPWEAGGLFQLFNAPGLLAHGLEVADKPITAMPFLDEEHYIIDEAARTKND